MCGGGGGGGGGVKAHRKHIIIQQHTGRGATFASAHVQSWSRTALYKDRAERFSNSRTWIMPLSSMNSRQCSLKQS